MINLGRELLKRQENERVELVTGEIAKVKELAIMLKCEFLLEGLNSEVVTKEVEVIKEIEVVKEIEVIKEVPADTKDLEDKIAASSKRIAELEEEVKNLRSKEVAEEDKPTKLTNREVDTIKAARTKAENNLKTALKEIEKLKKERDKYKDLSAKWQESCSEMSKSKNNNDDELNKANDRIKELEKQLAAMTTNANKYKESMATWQRKHDELKNSISSTISNNTKVKEKVNKEAPKNNIKESVDKPAVKDTGKIDSLVVCQKYKSNRPEVSMYDGGSYYVMASKTCQQITIIPSNSGIKVTDDVEKIYQQKLVDMGYEAERPNVSPVVIRHEEDAFSGYLARTDAFFGIETFSNSRDVVAGYVYHHNNCYLYTWDLEMYAPVVYDFKKVLNNEKHNVSSFVKDQVCSFVCKMFDLYKKEVDKITADAKAKAKANTEKAKEKAKDHANRSQRFNSKVNKAKSKGKVLGGSNKIVTNNKVSDNNRDNSEQQVCDSMSAESIGF